MLTLPLSLRTAPANLKARCEGRRTVGSMWHFWPDELLVSKDTVFGNWFTMRGAGLQPERMEQECGEAARIAAWYFDNREPHRPDGRVFYLLEPESVVERGVRESRVKAEVKLATAGVKAAGLRDKARASGVVEMF